MAQRLSRKRKIALITALLLSDITSDDENMNDDIAEAAGVLSGLSVVRNTRRARHRQHGYVNNIADRFRLDEFKTFFRVSHQSVEYLHNWIHPLCIERGITGIIDREGSGGTPHKPLYDRLLMLLWYLASKDKYASIADRFGLSESTGNIAIINLLQFIDDHLRDKVICWPTREEEDEIKGKYQDLRNFPGVVGMLDGSHIPIRRPSERGIDYYNRKDYYSIVLQAVCREDMRFTNVYCGWPGKVHDARIFRHSPLFEQGKNLCRDGHILADSAYPNMDWVLTPFRDNGRLTLSQRRFNEVHSSIRSTIERAFGLLKGRFPRLQHVDQRDVGSIVTTILAACVVHNICILNNDGFSECLCEEDVPQCILRPANYDAAAQDRGANKRLCIARMLTNN